jgi:hypothetical protein
VNLRLFIAFISLNSFGLFSQDSIQKKNLAFSGYVEIYYCYDNSNPANHTRQPFFYSFNRHNEVNINLAFLKASYNNDVVRANFALMAGTYPQYNLAHEPPGLKNIFESNLGIRLLKRNTLWLDVGVLPSHIGFESATGLDCWNLTRSILADNSPYYETGARISYLSKSEKLYFAGLVLNGWQRIVRADGNETPSFGTQLTVKPRKQFTFNWSTFAGNIYPDSVMRWRYFNNLYAQIDINAKFGLISGFDFGIEQQHKGSIRYDQWYAPIVILKFKSSKKTRIATRFEYYDDEENVIVSTPGSIPFKVTGASVNLDYLPTTNCMIRLEARTLLSPNDIFVHARTLNNSNSFFTASAALKF